MQPTLDSHLLDPKLAAIVQEALKEQAARPVRTTFTEEEKKYAVDQKTNHGGITLTEVCDQFYKKFNKRLNTSTLAGWMKKGTKINKRGPANMLRDDIAEDVQKMLHLFRHSSLRLDWDVFRNIVTGVLEQKDPVFLAHQSRGNQWEDQRAEREQSLAEAPAAPIVSQPSEPTTQPPATATRRGRKAHTEEQKAAKAAAKAAAKLAEKEAQKAAAKARKEEDQAKKQAEKAAKEAEKNKGQKKQPPITAFLLSVPKPEPTQLATESPVLTAPSEESPECVQPTMAGTKRPRDEPESQRGEATVGDDLSDIESVIDAVGSDLSFTERGDESEDVFSTSSDEDE